MHLSNQYVSLSRRDFLELLTVLGVNSAFGPFGSRALDLTTKPALGTYRPGRIDNEYSQFLSGEREALQTPPRVSEFVGGRLTASAGGQASRMRVDDQIDGWQLLAILTVNGAHTAVFEKHVTHRGAIAYVTEDGGVLAYVPKEIGMLSNIRPRKTNTPHGIKFERTTKHGPDIVGHYILDSAEDPCYENVAALGPEYVGWTLVANEEAGPEHSLYLDASGRSRQLAREIGLQALWAPDTAGPLFDPSQLIFQTAAEGFSSKRTLLAGYLPVADLAVWNPEQKTGYEVIVLLPHGKDAKPIARLIGNIDDDTVAEIEKFKKEMPDLWEKFAQGLNIFKRDGQVVVERYWNTTPEDFHVALLAVWSKWHSFHEGGLHVEIPDEWLLNAARGGITLTRCSYTGLEPTYQMGEGAYTKVPPSSHALFPVAQYEFIWAHQLWNHCESADEYFQHYLDCYIRPDGNFVYNTQDQVEAPLDVGLFLGNSARSYFYTRNLESFDKRLPILDRMIAYVLKRYEYSKITFGPGDRRHGLIWGSPEADLGDPKKDTPEAHPYFYQNAAGVWRGLNEHTKALKLAAQDSGRKELSEAASHYSAVSQQMRGDIERSLTATLASCHSAMRSTGITPFTPDDIDHDPTQLESYENHRFMEDWFLADWGDAALDLGHLKHRELAGRQVLGLGTSMSPNVTSNFMAHGTLSVLIRQDDYRPFLLSLYALACYAADSGNRYSPEDAQIPGGHPLEGVSAAWSAVVNSTLQTTVGLRWLLCYEETDTDVCHIQKAAPKHWFQKGKTIAVKNCPTRFGSIGWATHAVADRRWEITVDVPKAFSADLVVHVHPDDGERLRTASSGMLERNKIIFKKAALAGDAKQLQVVVS
jgi:hypothetical protein